MKTYIFFRKHEGKDMFYPVEYFSDDDAIAGALINKGTLKVERPSGEVVWQAHQIH